MKYALESISCRPVRIQPNEVNQCVNQSFRTQRGCFQFVESLQKEETVKSHHFSQDVTETFKAIDAIQKTFRS